MYYNNMKGKIINKKEKDSLKLLANRQVQIDKFLKDFDLRLKKIEKIVNKSNFAIKCDKCQNKAKYVDVINPQGLIDLNGNTKRGNFCEECYTQLI